MFRLSRRRKIIISTISLFLIFTFTAGMVIRSALFTDETNATTDTEFPIPVSDVNVAEVHFVNTQTATDLSTKTNHGSAVIIRTYDEKYLLFDTAAEDYKDGSEGKEYKDTNKNHIYNSLKAMQGNNTKVTIDYLVISHLHEDHTGNAVRILNDSNIVVKNLVIKYEKQNKNKISKYATIIKNAVVKGGLEKIYTNTGIIDKEERAGGDQTLLKEFQKKWTTKGDQYYNKFKEVRQELYQGKRNGVEKEAILSLGEFVDLYFFNTEDVWAGKNCDVTGYVYEWKKTKSTTNVVKRTNASYTRFDADKYVNPSRYVDGKGVVFEKTTDAPSATTVSQNYYYAYSSTKQYQACESNANSYAVVAKVKLHQFKEKETSTDPNDKFVMTGTNNKFILLTGDLENAGSTLETNHGYRGNGLTYLFKDKIGTHVDSLAPKYDAETNVAEAIMNKWNSTKNLVIYQIPHHWNNAAPEAVEILGINNSDVYAVASAAEDPATNTHFAKYRTYHYTLSKTRKYSSGTEAEGDGVLCAIGHKYDTGEKKTIDKYDCDYASAPERKKGYTPKTLTENYNYSGAPTVTEKCSISNYLAGTSTCRVVTGSATRTGYKFLGWADSSSAKTATHTAAKNLDISANKTIYAIWAPARTITLNRNDDPNTSTTTKATCYPNSTDGACNVTIPANPTRTGYKFLGWADSDTATTGNPDYTANKSISISANKSIYAIWAPARTLTSYKNDDNNSTPTTTKATCYPNSTNGACNVTIPANPTRTGYKFLGWADSDTATTGNPDYTANKSISISANRSIYAIWAPARTITLNRNDDPNTSTVANRTCYPASTTGSCEVTIPADQPTRKGYIFLGWADTATATTGDPNYSANSKVTLSANKTIYAIWEHVETPDPSTDPVEDSFPNDESIDDPGDDPNSDPFNNPGDDPGADPGDDPSEEPEEPTIDPEDTLDDTEGSDEEDEIYEGSGEDEVASPRSAYVVIQGDDKEYDLLQEKYISFHFDVDYELFIDGGYVSIDGVVISTAYYTSGPGSTIIYILSEYFNSLPAGEHTLTVTYSDESESVVKFTIVEPGVDGDDIPVPNTSEVVDSSAMSPDTGALTDNNESGLGAPIIIFPAIMTTIATAVIVKKHHKTKNG